MQQAAEDFVKGLRLESAEPVECLTVGNVVTPCTRKALGFRNGTGRVISKGEPRKLVLHNRDEGAVLIPEAHATTHRFTGF